LDQGLPGDPGATALLDAILCRANVEENFGFRYTRIPFTVLFAEGRLGQESIGQFEDQAGGDSAFLRDTDASSETQEGRFGFTISPWTPVSLTTQFKRGIRKSSYDHQRDEAFGGKNEGYSAFITGREIESSELSAKLSLRPFSWMQAALTYQLFASDYTTATEPYIAGLTFSPGGSIYAGNYDAQVYSASVSFSRWKGLYLANTFSYRASRTVTYGDLDPIVVPYKGDLYSAISTLSYIINKKSDVKLGYNYSWSDYGQNNFPAGLPLGLAYDWHQVSIAFSRKFSPRVTGTLGYQFYLYNERNTDGANDYEAHGVLASMTIALN
jgi:hypothetical protein